jgi:hypothetical protein
MPMTLTAVHDVAAEQTGIASAVLNTAQQIGAALGVAVLSTIATTASDEWLPHATLSLQRAIAANDGGAVAAARDALTHGYTTGFLAGAGATGPRSIHCGRRGEHAADADCGGSLTASARPHHARAEYTTPGTAEWRGDSLDRRLVL